MTSLNPADRQALLNLILEVSFERKDVTLASGKKSNFYLDLRQTLMRPKGVSLAGRLVLDLLQTGPPVEAVGGMAVGAVPLVSAVLAAAANDPKTKALKRQAGECILRIVPKYGADTPETNIKTRRRL